MQSANVTVTASQNFYTLQFSANGLSTVTTLTAGAPYYLILTPYNPYGLYSGDTNVTLNWQTDDTETSLPSSFTFSATTHLSTQKFVPFLTAGWRPAVVTKTGTGELGAAIAQVIAADVNKILIGGVATTSQAGAAQSPNITIVDAYGNMVKNYAGTVSFSVSGDSN